MIPTAVEMSLVVVASYPLSVNSFSATRRISARVCPPGRRSLVLIAHSSRQAPGYLLTDRPFSYGHLPSARSVTLSEGELP
ncbi:hypothetical protein BC739_008651 [Kutzneria viridogrisea]|uniref:Uncharacterized protein n=2 Tax=Kutzneria TaxID=43356 RepID=W5WJQ9_9PSEU|nr:hypothetical protein KALB_8081 [Kutzneria albida DSM 43870]MBA8931399.1 hypothetical protein [Kutzneria viridogrisea]